MEQPNQNEKKLNILNQKDMKPYNQNSNYELILKTNNLMHFTVKATRFHVYLTSSKL